MILKKILSLVLISSLSFGVMPTGLYAQAGSTSGERILVIVATPEDSSVFVDGTDRGKGRVFLEDVPLGSHRVVVSNPGYEGILTRDVSIRRNSMATVRVDMDEGYVVIKTEPIEDVRHAEVAEGEGNELLAKKRQYEAKKILEESNFIYIQGRERFSRIKLGDKVKGSPEAEEVYNKHYLGISLGLLGGAGAVLGFILFSEGAFRLSDSLGPQFSEISRVSNEPGIRPLEIIAGAAITILCGWFTNFEIGEASNYLNLAVESYNRKTRDELKLSLYETSY